MVSIGTKIRSRSEASPVNFRALEKARDAVATLRAIKPLLSPRDEETLSILIDKQLMEVLDKSIREAASGKLKPLASILK